MKSDSIEPTRVLLIEDNPADVMLLEHKLKHSRGVRFEITHVMTVEAAIMRFRARGFDVVLMDLSIPGSTGLETLSKFLKRIPNAPVIVMSGHPDPHISKEAINRGAEGFIAKGSDLSADFLEDYISQAIDRKSRERSQRLSRQETAALRNGHRVSHAFVKLVDSLESGLYELLGYVIRDAPAHAEAVRQIIEQHNMQASIYEMRALMDLAESRSTKPPPNDAAMLNSSPHIKPTPALSKRRIGAALHEWPDDEWSDS